MAFTYGFYNSKNGDRKYYAEQMAMLVDGLITNGVFMTVGNQFMVRPGSGMSVVVDTGHAWYDATWSHNDSEMIMTASQSDVLLDRIDALVLEVDKTESVRQNAIKWVAGTPGTNPVKPTLTFSEYLRQRPIAYVTIPANSTEITADNIEYVVGTSECPFATGVLEGMNIDNLVAQWEAQFIGWFDTIKDQLSEDAAGNLQNQINDVRTIANTAKTKADEAMPLAGGEFEGDVTIPQDTFLHLGNTFRIFEDASSGALYVQLHNNGELVSNPLYINSSGVATVSAFGASGHSLKNICVTNSSGAAVTGNTSVIYMYRK